MTTNKWNEMFYTKTKTLKINVSFRNVNFNQCS